MGIKISISLGVLALIGACLSAAILEVQAQKWEQAVTASGVLLVLLAFAALIALSWKGAPK